MYLGEVPKYRDNIVQALCGSPEIVRLLRPEDKPDLTPAELVYLRLYPYDHIVDKATEAGAYLCFDVDAPRVIDRAFTDFRITLWVIVHDRYMRLPEGLRTDRLSKEIELVMNGSRSYGLGEVELISWDRFNPAPAFHARALTYRTVDFNRA